MTIGELIKTTRKQAGMTQKQLAEKLGVSYVNISQLENDQRIPKYETVLSIATALGVEWEKLVPVNMQGNMIAAHVIEKAGLKLVSKKDEKVKQPSTLKDRIDVAFERLNDEGQQKAVERVEELTEIPRYRATATLESPQTEQEGKDTAQDKEPPTGH